MKKPTTEKKTPKTAAAKDGKARRSQAVPARGGRKAAKESSSPADAAGTKQSMTGEVMAQLIAAIKVGRLVPGQRLIAEDLAQLFGVSRAPIREALHILAGEGVVELVPNRGAKIRQLSKKELIDIVEFHQTICTIGLRHAAEKMNLASCRKIVDDAYGKILDAAKVGNSQKFINSLYEFHISLNEISGNSFVSFIYGRSTLYYYNLGLSEKFPGEHWDSFVEHYQNIYRAVITGDAQAACDLFVSHMDWVISLLENE